jgi:hypothetical protein
MRLKTPVFYGCKTWYPILKEGHRLMAIKESAKKNIWAIGRGEET